MKDIIDFNQSKKEVFVEYIKQLSLADDIKDYFLSDSFFLDDDSPDSYLYYAELFHSAFGVSIKKEIVQKLNISAFLYYRSILIQDAFIDFDDDKLNSKSLLLVSICQEESIKILSNVFPLDSVFWSFWNERRKEYLRAVKLDHTKKFKFSWDSFENLADSRSAFGKVAVDLWFVLSSQRDKKLHEELLKSHRKFSSGFQIIDDIQDFRSDLDRTQFNIAHHFLRLDLAKKNLKFEDLDGDLLHKYFYVLGTCKNLIDKASQYFTEALQLALDTEKRLTLWERLIQIKKREVVSFNLHLDAYIKILITDSKYSKKNKLVSNKNISTEEVKNSLDDVNSFIKRQLNPKGYWEDIYLNAGLSNVWVTGLISSLITEHIDFDRKAGIGVMSFIKKSQNDDGLWGYNTSWISDVDSSTCALLGLHLNGKDITQQIEQWLKLQNSDGGFSTYTDENKVVEILNYTVRNVDGWLNSHVCVSALAYFLLSHLDGFKKAKESLKTYLLSILTKDCIWDSYWWTSPLYSTCYILKGLMNEGIEEKLVQESIQKVLSMMNDNGSFADDFSSSNVFYTGLVLGTLCYDKRFYSMYSDKADSIVKWLLTSQFDDGSFPSSTCLRVPAPNVINPKNVQEWKIGNTSTNIVTSDKMRLLSSSAAQNGLSSYIQAQKNSR